MVLKLGFPFLLELPPVGVPFFSARLFIRLIWRERNGEGGIAPPANLEVSLQDLSCMVLERQCCLQLRVDTLKELIS